MADAFPAPVAPRSRVASPRLLTTIVVGLLVFAVALRLIGPGRVAWLQAAFIVFGSLVIQALPFVLIGALAAAVIEVFVPRSALERLTKLPRPLQLPAAGLAGIAFPICECGSVPVARRLISKGLMPAAGITFMLAAPVVNPVVIASTFVAYRGRGSLWIMVIGRFTLGLLVAMTVGWVLGSISKKDLLRAGAEEDEHDHWELGRPEAKWRQFFVHLGNDFLFMGRFLLLGATAAALVQTFLPQSLVIRVAGVPILSIVVMMGFAIVLSLCSESDAFIAASFVQFGTAAQLAFLVFGPMVDLKLGALYAGTFGKRVLRTIVVTAAIATLVGVLWVCGARRMSRTLDPISPPSAALDLAQPAPRAPMERCASRRRSRARVWAGLFWFLLLTHRVGLYLSTRTAWVVPVGAVLLTAAAVGRLASSRTRRPGPLVRRDAIVMGLMVLPVILITVLPPQTLGTYSVNKKAKYSSVNLSSIYGRDHGDEPDHPAQHRGRPDVDAGRAGAREAGGIGRRLHRVRGHRLEHAGGRVPA